MWKCNSWRRSVCRERARLIFVCTTNVGSQLPYVFQQNKKIISGMETRHSKQIIMSSCYFNKGIRGTVLVNLWMAPILTHLIALKTANYCMCMNFLVITYFDFHIVPFPWYEGRYLQLVACIGFNDWSAVCLQFYSRYILIITLSYTGLANVDVTQVVCWAQPASM